MASCSTELSSKNMRQWGRANLQRRLTRATMSRAHQARPATSSAVPEAIDAKVVLGFGPQRKLNKASQCFKPNATPAAKGTTDLFRPTFQADPATVVEMRWPFRAKAGHDHVRLRMASSLSSAISSHHERPSMERQDSSSKSGQMLAKQRLHSRCSGSEFKRPFATTVYHLSSRSCHCTKGDNSCSAGGRLVPTEYLFLRRNVRPPLALGSHVPFNWPANSGGACPRPIRQLGRQIGACPVFHPQWPILWPSAPRMPIPACRSPPPTLRNDGV